MQLRRLAGPTRAGLAIASTLVLGACLPSLDHALLLPACFGGAPNGHLDDSEQCDDGNADDGDGCSSRCAMECPAPGAIWRRADGGNDHCYTPLVPVASVDDARGRCQEASGAFLVTVRTETERAFVARAILAGQPPEARFHTAYELDAVDVTFGCPVPTPPLPMTTPKPVAQCTIQEAIASPQNLLREPGILAAYVAGKTPTGVTYLGSPQNACTGCFPDDLAAGFWTQAKDRLALDGGGHFVVVSPGDAVSGAICERAPAGDPPSCDGPSCAAGANTERRWNGYRYAYYSQPENADDAEATCAKAGGHLYYVESEVEREAVFRFFRNELTTTQAWLGLRGTPGGAYAWSDGVADDGTRPSPWAVGPFACGAMSTSCCAVIGLGPGASGTWNYGEGLARRASCGATATNPFLCKIPAP